MTNSWWANKLGGQQPAPQYTPPQTPPVSYPAQSYPQQQPPVVNPELQGHRIPQSATSSERCPNCASGNYGRSTPESRARCYDCGYPIQQSGSGVPGVRVPTEGPVQAAKQISTGGWNPTTIIGKVEG